jgi:hypothetical protein
MLLISFLVDTTHAQRRSSVPSSTSLLLVTDHSMMELGVQKDSMENEASMSCCVM